VLKYLGAKHLILTGLTTDVCVLFTANDAYMREYQLWCRLTALLPSILANTITRWDICSGFSVRTFASRRTLIQAQTAALVEAAGAKCVRWAKVGLCGCGDLQ
jgi:isochorismate hydrolase